MAKLGGFYWQGTDKGLGKTLKDSGLSTLTGFDLDYAITPQLQLRCGYQFIYRLDSSRIGGSNHHFVGIGLLYQWGHKAPSVRIQRDKSSRPVNGYNHGPYPTVTHHAHDPS